MSSKPKSAKAERPRRRQRWTFLPLSRLTRRILLANTAALILLLIGVLYANQSREGLIDIQIKSLTTQGEIIAAAIVDAGNFGPEDISLERGDASYTVRRLVVPTKTRARVISTAGDLLEDTLLLNPASVKTYEIAPPEAKISFTERLEQTYEWFIGWLPGPTLPVYREEPGGGAGRYTEVQAALRGVKSSAVRVNSQGEIIVSVAVPIQRFKIVMGALMLSTEGGEINEIVRNERIAILRVFVPVFAVMVLLAILLAAGIARPVRRLAQAAEDVRFGEVGPGMSAHNVIPDLTSRKDEIGELSLALRNMLDALYKRIGAIESFAADVSHEIKNPLTSLKSAVETLAKTENPESRTKLLEIIQSDVGRLDRLISDISNASRLDAELTREEMAEVDVGVMLETIVAYYRDRAGLDVAPIRLSLPENALVISGLKTRLGQVIRNLIDNAQSFSPPGKGIDIRLSRQDGTVRIVVEDQGPGIPGANLESIFRRFYTERPDTEAFGEHSGLGLSISLQIIEAHSGKIYAENWPEGGARFVIELPV